jgi:hypothetical protein
MTILANNETMGNDSQSFNRKFGLLFAFVFGFFSVYSAIKDAGALAVYGLLATGAIFGLVAVVSPILLTPLCKAWFKLGDLMGKLVRPLVLGTIFYVLITPVAVVTRLFGRDEMRLRRTNANTYWIDRAPPGPPGDSFKYQF